MSYKFGEQSALGEVAGSGMQRMDQYNLQTKFQRTQLSAACTVLRGVEPHLLQLAPAWSISVQLQAVPAIRYVSSVAYWVIKSLKMLSVGSHSGLGTNSLKTERRNGCNARLQRVLLDPTKLFLQQA